MSADALTSASLASAALSAVTADDLATIDFSRLVGLLNEPNMPSGGGATIRRVIDLARLRRGCRVLEVGSNTGYTSIEFASWIDGQVTGLDINPVSTAFARDKAASCGLRNVTFDVGDGQDLPYPDGAFDLIYCSNVTSFMDDHRKARDEYYRVLADDGLLVAVPIYYHTAPPEDLRRRVGEAIGVDLAVTSQQYWSDLFADPRAHLLERESYEYERQSAERIAAYVDRVLDQPHLRAIDPSVRDAATARLSYFYSLFDENLSYARYDILVYRRNHPNPEPVLHTTRRVGAPR